MHWILQENIFNEKEWENLVQALNRFSIPYSIHKVIPFIGELIPTPEPTQEKVICLGAYSMRHAAKKFGWNPGVYDLFDINFRIQSSYWEDLMLNADSEIHRFENVTLNEPSFIRPIDDSKYFAGKIFDVVEFLEWQNKVCVLEEDTGNRLTADTLVQVSKPKEIYAEYRFWIVNGKIITKSMYKRGDRVMYSNQVDSRFDDFVLKCIDIWQPAKAFVIDVCDTPGGIKIVEINTLNAAGLYAADVQSLVLALEEMEC
jgi:hypothetical protein